MSNKTISLFKVNMPKNVEEKLKVILESGFITEGPVAKEFEQKLQTWLGNPYVALTSSGTAALTIAMRLAGIGPGDEVITSPMTCLAMNEPILSVGGVPVWCDVDPRTGNIDAAKIEDLITAKTKAILFVDWGGTPAELDLINEIAKKYSLKTIEDAAHSFGANYKGRKVGTICDYTCFSFQAIKHMTTIDGGAIACKNQTDYDRAILLRWFGCKRGHNTSPIKWEGDVMEYGYKFHMSDVNAAIGLESLKTIDSIVKAHKKNGRYLMDNLKNCPSVTLLEIPNYIDSAFWIFTIKVDDRTKVSRALTDAGIGNNIVHTRNDSYSLFNAFKSRNPTPGLDSFGKQMLSIPCGWWVTTEDLDYIVTTLRNVH